MNTKKAKQQAEKIPADKREEEIYNNLLKASKELTSATKDLDKQLKKSKAYNDAIVRECNPKHARQAQDTVIQANKLIAELKAGGNLQEIVTKLNSLKVK